MQASQRFTKSQWLLLLSHSCVGSVTGLGRPATHRGPGSPVERDTWAMVRLMNRLRDLATGHYVSCPSWKAIPNASGIAAKAGGRLSPTIECCAQTHSSTQFLHSGCA